MDNVFICFTSYHLLITVLKLKNEDNNYLLLSDELKIYDNNIKEINLFKDIVYFNDKKLYSKFPFYSKEIDNKFIFLKNKELYLFNDYTNIGTYLHRKKLVYNLLEDGYNNMIYLVFNQRKNIKSILRNFLFNTTMYSGYSKYCKSIEVNDLSEMVKDERFHKFKEVKRKELFTPDKFDILIKLFNVRNIDIKPNSILIITQPLFKDKLMDSEEEQILYYKNIVEKYKEYNIYIKIHPRDDTDYSKLGNVYFLDRYIPLELYGLNLKNNFKIGITHSSTSIYYIDFVDEKIVLNEFKKIKEN